MSALENELFIRCAVISFIYIGEKHHILQILSTAIKILVSLHLEQQDDPFVNMTIWENQVEQTLLYVQKGKT